MCLNMSLCSTFSSFQPRKWLLLESLWRTVTENMPCHFAFVLSEPYGLENYPNFPPLGEGIWFTSIRGGTAGKSEKPPCHIPENHTLSRSKIFLNNTLSLSFLERHCALQRKFVINYQKMRKYRHPSDLNHIHSGLSE